MNRFSIVAASVLLIATAGAAQAQAQPASATDENVFVMGGPFTSDYFSDALTPWDNTYESNFFAGVGYQRFLYEYGAFKLGVEAGLGLRSGYADTSLEAWGGAVARLDMIELGDIRISPALTAGLSVVTDTIGVETERAEAIGREVPLLYYLGPEIAVSHASLPYEGFIRLQHRSGGFGTIANIDGSNAVTLGLRYKF